MVRPTDDNIFICKVHVAGKGILTEYSLTYSSISFPHHSVTPSSSLLHILTPLHPSSSTQVDWMKMWHKYLLVITDSHHNQVHHTCSPQFEQNHNTHSYMAPGAISCSIVQCVYMRKGLGIFLDNHEKPVATQDWTGGLRTYVAMLTIMNYLEKTWVARNIHTKNF